MKKSLFDTRILLLSLLVGIFLLGGCSNDKDESTESQAKSEIAATEKKDTAASRHDEEIVQWNTYVDFSNEMDQYLFQALDKYFIAYGDGESFQKSQDNDAITRFYNTTLNSEDFMEAIDKAIAYSAKDAGDDLDKAVAAVAPNIKELWASMVEMGKYMHDKVYVDDDYAKARELHTKIMSSYQEAGRFLPGFYSAIESREAEIQQKNLEHMKEQGLQTVPAMLLVLLEAEKIHSYFEENKITAANVDKLDLKTFRPLYNAYGESLKRLEEIAADKSLVEKEGLYYNGVADYIKVATEAKTTAATMIERIQENKPRNTYSDSGTPEKFTKNLDLLIDRYNTYSKSR